jgi:NTP pyrophosphatase (non-canonical NTP hydrolase)
MEDIRFSDMMKMQLALHEKHQHWEPLVPKNARNMILWMIDELGEAIAIIKKRGDSEIMDNPETRNHFVEELSDVLMYFNDMLLSYNITPDEISQAYIQKHKKNMKRDYIEESNNLFAAGKTKET